MPKFTQHFDTNIFDGESISLKVGRYTVTASINHDNNYDKPDHNDEGFWPNRSNYTTKNINKYYRDLGHAKYVYDEWTRDNWWFGGVLMTVTTEDQDGEEIELVDGYECALWGIEVNYPVFDGRRRPNAYLREVANELLPQALEQADAAVAQRLKEMILGQGHGHDVRRAA